MAEALTGFHFPDDLWARVVYDLVLATRRGEVDTAQLVAALVPIYFGRVGSFVIENRNLTTADAEERVERQAREFELLKPYLVERWRAMDVAAAGGAATSDAGGHA
jgi:glucosylglycerate synthase